MTSLASSLLTRLRSNLGLKLLLLVTLPPTTTAAYLLVQRKLFLPTWNPPLTWLDRLIAFQPAWTWAYMSLYLLMPIGPLLSRSRADLMKYTHGVLFYFAVGLICFVAFPVAAPRPTIAPGYWLYLWLISFDKSYNCIPSLHATCAVFAVLYSAYASRDTRRVVLRRNLLIIGWIWVALILYATIATRQHFVIDLPAGILLAVIAYRWAVQTGGVHESRSFGSSDRPVGDTGVRAR